MESFRISFGNLLQVVLGSFCSSWVFEGSDPAAVAQFIRSVSLKCHVSRNTCPAWIHMLADASDAFLQSKGVSRSLNRKLITLGRSRGSTILAETRVPPVFGLINMKSMVSLLKTPEYQLKLLRTHAARCFSKDAVNRIMSSSRVQVFLQPRFRGGLGPEPELSAHGDNQELG